MKIPFKGLAQEHVFASLELVLDSERIRTLQGSQAVTINLFRVGSCSSVSLVNRGKFSVEQDCTGDVHTEIICDIIDLGRICLCSVVTDVDAEGSSRCHFLALRMASRVSLFYYLQSVHRQHCRPFQLRS